MPLVRFFASVFFAGLMVSLVSAQLRRDIPFHNPAEFFPTGSLPVHDLIASVDTSGAVPHIRGSFRILKKDGFDLRSSPPTFLYSYHDPRQDYPPNVAEADAGYSLTEHQWSVLSSAKASVEVTVPSDFSTDPVTSAIVEFDIPFTPRSRNRFSAPLGSPRALAVVMEGFFVDDDPRESPSISRHEWSFAICSLPEPGKRPVGEAGLDTNSVMPIGLAIPESTGSKLAIGASDHTIWAFDFFRGWRAHWHLDSTPQIYCVSKNNLRSFSPQNWFAQPWTIDLRIINGVLEFGHGAIAGEIPQFRYAQGTSGNRRIDIGEGSKNQYVMVYLPDITDMEARKHFQIGGVVIEDN